MREDSEEAGSVELGRGEVMQEQLVSGIVRELLRVLQITELRVREQSKDLINET